jgi:hypothetical protein
MLGCFGMPSRASRLDMRRKQKRSALNAACWYAHTMKELRAEFERLGLADLLH